jgi:uncharacterized repeat protein (TIGR04138 family)
MAAVDVHEGVRAIVRGDPRFHPEAYLFVCAALDFTVRRLREARSVPEDERMHVTGPELLEGIRDFGREHFGLLGKAVLEEWGVRSTADVGEIVFNLVDHRILRKDERDRKEDFAGVYDFDTALVDGYEIDFPTGEGEEEA